MSSLMKLTLAAAGAVAIASFIPQAWSQDGDWVQVNGNAGNSKYSPLNQITPSNVASLKKAWSHDGGAGSMTPIAVNGVLYYPSGSVVFALDGETGTEIWNTDLGMLIPSKPGDAVNEARPADFGRNGGGGPPGRRAPAANPNFLALGNAAKYGVAYWPGNGSVGPRIVIATSGGYLVQLDAKTGDLIKDFGKNGALDLRVGMMEKMNLSDYTPGALATVYKNYAIIAPRTSENGRYGTPGDPRAFDLLTGKLIWQFHVIPRPGEDNFGQWGLNGWQDRRGAGSWVPMSVDTKNGLVFMATGNATDQDYGGTRPGNNLYATSVLALDGDTGKLRWYFQTTHHDIYDWDVNSPPVLIEMKDKSGNKVEAVAQTTKNGYLFVLDRLTGKPILPIEQRVMPPTDAPGEVASETQPVPLYPGGTVARVGMTRDEVANLSPESHKFCLNIYDNVVHMGEGTPYGMVPSLVFPSSTGGPNTAGATFDPKSNTIFVNVQNMATLGMLTPALSVGKFETLSKSKIPFDDQNGYPCSPTPWGELEAIDAATGEFKWRVPLGEYKELTAKGIPPTGMIPRGGVIITGGGILFDAATEDKMFRAFDPKNGQILWKTQLPGAGATPMTYKSKSGKEFVVVATANSVQAFALP